MTDELSPAMQAAPQAVTDAGAPEAANDVALLPCPFCGGGCDPRGWLSHQIDPDAEDGSGNELRGPECEVCGATADTLDRWNTRAPDPATATIAALEAENRALHGFLSAFLGSDEKLQVGIGGNPIYVETFIANARAALASVQS